MLALADADIKASRFEKLFSDYKSHYKSSSDAGHDFSHIVRVIGSCLKLGRQLSANLEVLLPAALLHDVINVPKDHPDRLNASKMAAEEAKIILRKYQYSEDEIDSIAMVILEHSFSLGASPSCLESSILQDADRLDALGAIGIMRLVTCGSRMNAKYYNISDPFAKCRPLDDKRFSVDHFATKLMKLSQKMNTSPAKMESIRRTEFITDFLLQLKSEIESEDTFPFEID